MEEEVSDQARAGVVRFPKATFRSATSQLFVLRRVSSPAVITSEYRRLAHWPVGSGVVVVVARQQGGAYNLQP